MHGQFPLRPCDASFEPDPALPLGLACLYAQVRSCAAPCLTRASEADYRALAARATSWLADPSLRGEAGAAVPATVAAVDRTRAVIVDAGRRDVGLYPVREGRVLDDAAILGPPSALDAAIERLEWPEPEGPDDWRWLAAWLRGAKGRATWIVARAGAGRETLAVAVRRALPARFAPPAPGDNVEAVQGEV